LTVICCLGCVVEASIIIPACSITTKAEQFFVEDSAGCHIQGANVWYRPNDIHRSFLRGRLGAVGSEASLDGRVGLAGSAGNLPHDSFEILIRRHGLASRPRNDDPQRPRPRAGCLKSATDEDMLPFASISAIRLGRIEEGQACGPARAKFLILSWMAVNLVSRAC
jgi:hypothetical protein